MNEPKEGTVNTETKILRLPAVLERVGIGKTALYGLISRGEFPPPIKLSARAVGWCAADVEQWINERPRTGEARAA